MPSAMEMPKKTLDMHNHHIDSTVWDFFNFRSNDIVIASWPKCGTTLTQQMISQLIFNAREGVNVDQISPWLDMRIPPREQKLAALDAQTHRRFMKTYLPVNALLMSSNAKYIFIGRDGRDAVWSLHNHHSNASEVWYAALNDTPELVGPPMPRANPDAVAYFREWLDGDGYPLWSFWDVVKSWWEVRHLPNVLFIHYSDVIRDKKQVIQTIAEFLDIQVDENKWDNILEHCSMDYMRKHVDKLAPAGGIFWEEAGKTFIFKGVNGRWKDVLPQRDCERYMKISRDKLGENCARWLANGGVVP